MKIKKIFNRWTYSCWISKDLEETLGASYRFKSDLVYSKNLHSGNTCNCVLNHKPIKIIFTVQAEK